MVLLYIPKGTYALHFFLGNWHSYLPSHILFLQSHSCTVNLY